MSEFTIASSADARTLTLDLKAPRFVNYVDEPDSGDIRRYPRIVLGSSLDLQDNVGAFAKRYNDILAAPLPARASAAVAKARRLAPPQRVVALMRYLNENFRYLSDWRASERDLVPFSLAEIERHGYGDCKDLSTLLTAMLRAAGVKAEPVWVRRDAFTPAALAPTIYAIVRAEVDVAVWWLDPTNPVFAPGMVMPDVQDRWAWVLGADGRVRQDLIPLEAPRAALDAKLRQRFADGEKGSIDGTLALGGHMLMDLSVSDRNEGKSSGDRAICSLIATEPGQCNVERRATSFLVPEQYAVKAHITDLRALDRNAGKFEFARPDFATLWDAFARYKRNG
ncbi:hypothetical protein BPUN_4770 [Candidatus Paraburkholderia kirkii]|nr:hypothetical protein BPUN_4770 [Candidatus Paraburkholderia kirkii]